MTLAEPILEMSNVTRNFGALAAVRNLSFAVKPNSITSLIGPNGAGKSTIFNLVTGFTSPTSGEILYRGRSLRGLKPHQINRLGIARAFQISLPFVNLSVRENIRVGALFGRPGERDTEKVINEAIELCGLTDTSDRPAGELTVGGLRKLELARALATRPSLLMADEPLAGLVPTESQEILATLQRLRDEGVAVFLVEHDMQAVMAVSDRVIVVEAGSKIFEGLPHQVVSDPRVIEAYLGVEDDMSETL
jgi:branched-chain amino acid transport system ATP-binding protein